ncbi:TspO/MBR family protein [Pseudahrensia aquimaris]|uniref:TspO/MBR family protein n=1 Tax=Pseudahrensia aquimaris TaxID=744461 RepID=A0ABW3FJ42_9HYPH
MSWSLLAFVGLNFFAALSGAVFAPGEWFKSLKKPTWQPPDWAFPVVWSILFLLNSVAGWLVYSKVGFSDGGMLAMAIYVGSLVLNAAWSALFFGMKRMDLATYEAAVLWLSLVAQIAVFYPIEPIAALITLPYLAWVTVAFVLSRTVWRLNPEEAQARA